jgi:hypothetical protein
MTRLRFRAVTARQLRETASEWDKNARLFLDTEKVEIYQ